MSKFLDILNESMPINTDEIDNLIEGKRALQRYLFDNGIKVQVKTFKDIITFTLPEGMVVEVEVVGVTNNVPTEDAEDPEQSIKNISAIAAMPDGKITSSTGRKLNKAKKTMADAAVKIAQSFKDTAG